MAEFSDYSWLIGDAGTSWLARLASDPRRELQQLAALRREMSPERARLLVDQMALRRRAAAKFGAHAQKMYFTRVHLEQATDLALARHKAARFAALGADASLVGDYCCGIGGDLMALAEAAPVIGWDRSPIARMLADANLRAVAPAAVERTANVREADVEHLTPAAGEAWHLDPDRRPAGRRTSRVELYAPGPDLVDRWLAAHPHGAVKLAPAADPPPTWADRCELEWISSQGECRQLVAWFGGLAHAAGQCRATQVRGDLDSTAQPVATTLAGLPGTPCESVEAPAQYLFDPDPAVLAADLLGVLAQRHGLRSLGAGGAYLTSDHPENDQLVTTFAVVDCLPLRVGDLARSLTARGVGRLEIKKRGVAVDPETLRRRLKLRGTSEATLILTRIGRREVAIIAQRLFSEPAQPSS